MKVTVAGQHVVAKGSWGAGHVWRRARPGAQRAVLARPERPVSEALSAAIDFLLSQQAHTGRWSDFLLPAGPSDEWVTAFVGACLLEAPGEGARRAARRAWEALLRRRPAEPGWGYNRLTPVPSSPPMSWSTAASRPTPSEIPSGATRGCRTTRRSRAGKHLTTA